MLQDRGGAFPTVSRGASSAGGRPSARRAAHLLLAVANRLLPKDPDLIALYSAVDVEDGLLAVAQECRARGWEPVVLLEDRRRAALLRSLSGGEITTVSKRSVRGILTFLRARFVVASSRLHGDHRPPDGQVVVTLWHGEPPTKAAGRFSGGSGVHCTYAPVCSTVGRAYRAAEFDLAPLQVPIIGAPRNDRMLQADRADLRRRLLGPEAHLPTLIWMPSFRVGRYGAERRTETVGGRPEGPFPPADLHRLDAWLHAHDARVVIKVHPRDAGTYAGDYRAIRVLLPGDLERQGLTLYPAMSAFDGLVTDMSSVWLDYLLLDLPIVFAFPDVADYRAGRGLNLEPYEHWVPGPFVTDVDGLVEAVADVVMGSDPMAEERGRARLRFHQHLDAGSTTRLLDGLGILSR